MWGVFGKIFGSDKIIDAGIDAIDALHYSDEEEAEDKRKLERQKVDLKIKEKESYHPYRLTQRMIALSAWFTFLFIVQMGLYTILFGDGELERIKVAIDFMNQMWMGEIVFAIISFYFGYDLKKKFDKDKK